MNYTKFTQCCIALFLCLFTFNTLEAQDNEANTSKPENIQLPIFLDFFANTRGFGAQSIIKRKLASSNLLGVFSLNMFHSNWKPSYIYDREAMSQTYLTFNIFKGFSANIGYHFSSLDKMAATFSFSYAFRSQDWFILLMPRVDLKENPNVEGFALLQYSPALTKHWRFYIRAELLASRNFALEKHVRTFGMFFLGLKKRDFTFGPCLHWDMYGEHKEEYFGVGGFLQIQLH